MPFEGRKIEEHNNFHCIWIDATLTDLLAFQKKSKINLFLYWFAYILTYSILKFKF
jgi:hypothetical protein